MAIEDRRRPIAVGALLVAFLLVEVLRVWSPSLLRGEAAPPNVLAALGLGALCFMVAPLLAWQVHRLGATALWVAGGIALLAGRGALVLTDGGLWQLAAASVAVTGATVALTGLAAGLEGSLARQARTGVLLGVAAATALHLGTRTAGLTWPSDTLVGSGVAVALLVAFAVALRAVARTLRVSTPGAALAWPWWILLPLLLLTGVLSGVPGRMAVATGWDSGTVAATLASGQAGAVATALLAPRIGAVRAGGAGAALVLVGTASALQAVGWQGVLGQLGVATGLGLLVGAEPFEPAPDDSEEGGVSPRRRALACAGALLLFHVLASFYHLDHTLPVPADHRLLLLLVALFAAALGVASAVTGRKRDPRSTIDAVAATRVLLVLVVMVALVGLGGQAPERTAVLHPDPDRELRVATYNVDSGFDTRGRFDPWSQAELLRDHAPDVVVLNEVDRGWLANGGHDAFDHLATELGLPHVRFGAAADAVFGNALLSRFPISELAVEPLPGGEDPMERGLIAAVLQLPGDRAIGVVGTQLSQEDDPAVSRLPQSRSVAATAARLRERQVPTIVLGDVHTTPDGPELDAFGDLVVDVLPEGAATFPARAPSELRSQVLASTDLRPVDLAIPSSAASRHLPVVVSFQLVEPPD